MVRRNVSLLCCVSAIWTVVPAGAFQVAEIQKSRSSWSSLSSSTWWESPHGSNSAIREMGGETVGSSLPFSATPPQVDTGVGANQPYVRAPLLPMEGGPVRRDIRRGFGGGGDRGVFRVGGGVGSVFEGSMTSGGGYASSNLGPSVQGGSLRTFRRGGRSSNPDEKTVVEFGTDGRPLEGNFQVWDGPDNTPTNVNIYSQDGYRYGFRMVTGRRFGDSGGAETYQVRNTGPMEFPIRARVDRTQYQYDSYGGGHMSHLPSTRYGGGYGVSEEGFPVGDERRRRSIRESPYSRGMLSPPAGAKTIQGGSTKVYTIGQNVESVRVELHSQGLPIMARVELLQGPNNVKTLAQVYQQDGYDRPFVGIMDTPGPYKGSIRIVNDGPMAFPITASVQPYEQY